MSKTFLLMGSALLASAALAAGSASAGVTFIPLGGGLLAPAGYSVITDFNTTGLGTLTFTSPATTMSAVTATQSGITTGSLTNVYSAPLLLSGPDMAPYLAVEPGSPVTVTPVGNYNEIALYIGSLDNYNNVSFTFDLGGTPVTLSGAQVAAMAGNGAAANSSPTSQFSNGLFEFTFSQPIKNFTVSSSTPAFEIAEISGGVGVPEPASWAIMLVGLGGLGAVLRHRRRNAAFAA